VTDSPQRDKMRAVMNGRTKIPMAGCLVLLAPIAALAGGGPLNVMVVYNDDAPEARAVAEHDRDARNLPNGHLCAIYGIDSAQTSMSIGDYETLIGTPVEDCITALPLPGDIDYLVTIRGLPYLVGGFSLSAVLQAGHATHLVDGGPLLEEPIATTLGLKSASRHNPLYLASTSFACDLAINHPQENWYASACGIVAKSTFPNSFRRQESGFAQSYDFNGHLFIVTRLDGFDYEDAHDLIDRAVAAEAQSHSGQLLCMAGKETARAARDPECEFVTRKLASAGFDTEFLSPFDANLSGRTLMAYFTGAANMRNAIDENTFEPGAIACNLTSLGAQPKNFFCDDADTCPETEAQTSIARFVRAGVTGVHGTVAEPLNTCFPNAGTLLLYTAGYNMGESFLFNQRFIMWRNLLVGDPLTTPYATRPTVTISGHEGNQLLQDTPLTISVSHPDGVAKLALYVDGRLVNETSSNTISYTPTASAGDAIQIHAVATANDSTLSRPGWSNPQPISHADVQGWASISVSVVTEYQSTSPSPKGEGGCSLRSGGAASSRVPICTVTFCLFMGLYLRRHRNRDL
jgi:uncharacterized protein (TIGR03790 family)